MSYLNFSPRLVDISRSSLSLKNSTSQDMILRELDKPKARISEALHAASRPVGGSRRTQPRQSNARISRNLRLLAEAAEQFHTSASLTAGTVRSDSSDAPWRSYPGAGCLFGGFPSSPHERVERSPELQVEQQPKPSPERSNSRASNTFSPVVDKLPLSSNDNISDGYEGGEDEDEDSELPFLKDFRDLATESIRDTDYDKVTPKLEAKGHRCVAIALPTTSEDIQKGLGDDVQDVQDTIRGEINHGRDVVLIVHSYGGHFGDSAVKGLARNPHGHHVPPSGDTIPGHVIRIVIIGTGFTVTEMVVMDGLGGKPTFTVDFKHRQGSCYYCG